MNRLSMLILLLHGCMVMMAQSMVQVRGIVYDVDSGGVLDSVTVLVKGSSRIMQNKPDGSFSIFIRPSDTLVFGLYGYRVKYISFKDSARDRDYFINVNLSHFQEVVKEITIYEARAQREIRHDISSLYMSRVYSLERVDAVQSPVTAIYEAYSRKAQSKRMLRDYEFEIAKNHLVQELLTIYNKQGIIAIPEKSYREFVEYLNLDWYYLTTASDYDLAVFIRQKAMEWNR
jgi:hypothetical protein